MSVFKQFLEDFQAEGEESGTYIRKINQLIEENNRYLNLDCNDLRTFPTTSKLYEQLILFPQKIIQVFDVVVNELVSTLHPSTPFSIHIHVFNIGNKHPMRDLSTDNIDQLVCIEGMITRVGDLIPDIRIASFVCSNCKHRAEVHRIGNRIDCPARCEQCHSPNTMRIDSTDCIFNDKQVVKMQEVPDQVPQGETPQSVTMFASEELFDCVKPGDKVEVTGIFRALPVRISPNRTTVRDVFNTFIDVLHYRKKVDKRFAVERKDLREADGVDRPFHLVELDGFTESQGHGGRQERPALHAVRRQPAGRRAWPALPRGYQHSAVRRPGNVEVAAAVLRAPAGAARDLHVGEGQLGGGTDGVRDARSDDGLDRE